MSVFRPPATELAETEPANGSLPAATGAVGRLVKGPSALGSDPGRLWHLTWTLARTEFKLAFFGSTLG